MPDRSFLTFAPARRLPRSNARRGGSNKPQPPPIGRQSQRLNPQFRELQRAFERHALGLATDIAGADPEKVLVLETLAPLRDFAGLIRNVGGLEWLGDIDEEDIPEDEDFHFGDAASGKAIKRQLYLVMSNQVALGQMIQEWNRFERGETFPRGRTQWRDLFSYLRSVRPWGVEDRLPEELDALWPELLAQGVQTATVELDLWFRASEAARSRSAEGIRLIAAQMNAEVLAESQILEIAYHGVLIRLQREAIEDLAARRVNILTNDDQVMYFRPAGQSYGGPVRIEEVVPLPARPQQPALPTGSPVVAVLDGAPIENHAVLSGRLVVDDPDGFAANYPVRARIHGTQIASMVIHGDLDADNVSLAKPVYVRPILRPDPQDFVHDPPRESVPRDVLATDLIHRAVVRMLADADTAGDPPASPEVRVINLSIGDVSRPLRRGTSPLARLLDWLSHRYNVVFIVSAGNYSGLLYSDTSCEELRQATPEDKTRALVIALAQAAHERRLLSPAEAVNALTVGAAHADASGAGTPDRLFEPIAAGATEFPSPVSALGLGHRRSIKPDVLASGGRQLYRFDVTAGDADPARLEAVMSGSAPGQRAAAPGATPLALNATAYFRGSSNAAANVSHLAGQILEQLTALPEFQRGQPDTVHLPVLTKALVVHGARWGEAFGTIREAVSASLPQSSYKEFASRFLGYGLVNAERSLGCTDQRVTLLGWGSLETESADEFEFPLPMSLNNRAVARRLSVTLAWLTPVNFGRKDYRRAVMWFEPEMSLTPDRQEADGRAVMRGTVQHEIFDGRRAEAFIAGSSLRIRVNCREEAGQVVGGVLYGLAVTLEVSEQLALPIYDEILARIPSRVAIRPS